MNGLTPAVICAGCHSPVLASEYARPCRPDHVAAAKLVKKAVRARLVCLQGNRERA